MLTPHSCCFHTHGGGFTSYNAPCLFPICPPWHWTDGWVWKEKRYSSAVFSLIHFLLEMSLSAGKKGKKALFCFSSVRLCAGAGGTASPAPGSMSVAGIHEQLRAKLALRPLPACPDSRQAEIGSSFGFLKNPNGVLLLMKNKQFRGTVEASESCVLGTFVVVMSFL